MQRGQLQGTPKQKEFVKNVKRVYLPWDTAPQVYKDRYPRWQGRAVKQIALPYKDDWLVCYTSVMSKQHVCVIKQNGTWL